MTWLSRSAASDCSSHSPRPTIIMNLMNCCLYLHHNLQVPVSLASEVYRLHIATAIDKDIFFLINLLISLDEAAPPNSFNSCIIVCSFIMLLFQPLTSSDFFGFDLTAVYYTPLDLTWSLYSSVCSLFAVFSENSVGF